MLYDPKWEIISPAVSSEPWRLALLNAATRIERRGWTQGQVMDCAGALCTIGALTETCVGDCELFDQCVDQMNEFLDINCIAAWNDDQWRTKDEILTALRACAAR